MTLGSSSVSAVHQQEETFSLWRTGSTSTRDTVLDMIAAPQRFSPSSPLPVQQLNHIASQIYWRASPNKLKRAGFNYRRYVLVGTRPLPQWIPNLNRANVSGVAGSWSGCAGWERSRL